MGLACELAQPRTLRQVKAAYKKHGPCVSERERRELHRAVELEQRAERLKRSEARKKASLRRKSEKEQRERKERTDMGVGLATQLIGFSHTQAQLKRGMEAFLGLSKDKTSRNVSDVEKRRDTHAFEVLEPWELDEVDDETLMAVEALVFCSVASTLPSSSDGFQPYESSIRSNSELLTCDEASVDDSTLLEAEQNRTVETVEASDDVSEKLLFEKATSTGSDASEVHDRQAPRDCASLALENSFREEYPSNTETVIRDASQTGEEPLAPEELRDFVSSDSQVMRELALEDYAPMSFAYDHIHICHSAR